jgi:hypothetical protein
MDRTLIAMAVDFCRQRRFLSTCILDAVARDFTTRYPTPSHNNPTLSSTNATPSLLYTEYSTVEQYQNQFPSSKDSDSLIDPNASMDTKEMLLSSFSYGSRHPSPSCSYAPHELVLTLRAYGLLNYLPTNSAEFFSSVETAVAENFNVLDPGSVLDLLTSFVYIERFPINFITRIFTPHFLAKIKGMREPSMRQRASRCLLQLQTAVRLEFPPHKYFVPIDRSSLNISLTWLEGRNFRFHQEMGTILRQLIGSNCFTDVHVPNNTPHLIDFKILTDSHRTILSASSEQEKHNCTKLAVIGIMPEHYCVNTQHLLGEPQTKLRHLKKLNYKIIQVDYEMFMWKCRGVAAKTKYLKSLLSSCIAFDTTNTSAS